MMPGSVFECATPKCAYTIDPEGMNKIQLEALRRWGKTCPQCKQHTKWQEKLPLLKTEISKVIGGSKDAKPNQTIPKTQSQKRKAARHDGQH